MRHISSAFSLATLLTAVSSNAPSESSHADSTTDMPDIPHPYWWQGPYTESLKDNVYASGTPFPLPTFHLSSAESGDIKSNYPTQPPNSAPCKTDTVLPYPQVPSSSSSSQGLYSPSVSSALPTFVYSPRPSSSVQPFPTPCPSSALGYSVTSPKPGVPSASPSSLGQGYPYSYLTSTPEYSAPPPGSTPVYPISLSPNSVDTVVQPTYLITAVQPTPSRQSFNSYQPITESYPVPISQSPVPTYVVIPIPTPVNSSVTPIYTVSVLAPSAIPSLPTSSNDQVTIPASEPASAVLSLQTSSGSSLLPPLPSSLGAESSVTKSVVSASQAIPASPTTFATQASYVISSALSSIVSSVSGNPTSSGSASTSEPSSVLVAATSARSSFVTSTSTQSSAPTRITSIPLAPSAASAPVGLSGRGKEKVWWVAFLLPLLLPA